MKGILPTLRKWNRSSPALEDLRPQLGSRRKKRQFQGNRSFDETLNSPSTGTDRGYFRSTTPRSLSDEVNSTLLDSTAAYYSSDSDGQPSPCLDEFSDLERIGVFDFHIEKPRKRGILKHQRNFDGPSPGSSPVRTKMVDQQDIITLTKHVRSFSHALGKLRLCFMSDEEDNVLPEEVQAKAHDRLGDVVLILKGVIQRYPTLNPTEILSSAQVVIKKVKEHNYSLSEEPNGFFEATDQLALAFSNSVSDYLEDDLSQNLGQGHADIGSLNNAGGYEDEDDERRAFYDGGIEYHESFEDNSEKAASVESLDKLDYEGSKQLSFNLDARAASSSMNESEIDKNLKEDLSVARAEELDKTLISIEGSVEISLQRTKVWSKYAKDIITYMERRAHIESDYCKQLMKLAQATKSVITEESYLPFQSTYVTALEYDITFAKRCQEKLQQELKGKIIEQLTFRRNEHDRNRSKLKEKWNKECKKLSDSINNLKKAKSMYIQKQQELKKFVDKQEKEEGNQGSSVVPSFSIGKKKKEEDIAKRAEEAEEYYKKCVEESNIRQSEVENVRETVLRDLRELVYQCDMTMRAVTCGYFQTMEHLAAHLPQQYSALAKDSKQSEVGKQFAQFIKLQQTVSKKATQKRFSFEIYRAEDRTDSDRGYIGPADYLNVTSPEADMERKESPNNIHRRISTISAGSDNSLNRPSSPIVAKKRHNAWGVPNRNSNSDDTASVSSRSLPGSPAGSPTLARKDHAQRLSLSTTEMDIRDGAKKELAGPFRNLKLSNPALSHTFKKLRSSSKCKKCDSYVYFNGAECELCGLTCHKKCLETLAIKCGKSRLPRKMTTFGVDFQKHLDATKRQDIPLIMEKCITELDLRCLQVKGLYRVSGVKTKVEALSQQFETAGAAVDLQSINPNLITSVLKLYLRELPEPLMTFDLYPEFIQIAKESSGLKFCRPEEGDEEVDEENDTKCEDVLRRLHECVLKLPHANYFTVLRLFKHLRRVANNEVFNQMSVNNLAIIFGPNLLRPKGSPSSLSALVDMPHQVRIVELLIMNTNILDEDYEQSKKKKTKTIEEEDEKVIHDETDTKRSSSVQSEQDLGYNTQPDQLDDGKQELSLSDELQIDFPEIFRRTDSDGRDLASSFGSLDSVPDMPSPDVDEELKDLIVRSPRPLPGRPTSLNFDYSQQTSSCQNLLSGSESNISFGSMSPVELPDSSLDLGRDEPPREKEGEPSKEVYAQVLPDSNGRSRRVGQVAIDSGPTKDANGENDGDRLNQEAEFAESDAVNVAEIAEDEIKSRLLNENGEIEIKSNKVTEINEIEMKNDAYMKENKPDIKLENENCREAAIVVSYDGCRPDVDDRPFSDDAAPHVKSPQKMPPKVAPKPCSPVRTSMILDAANEEDVTICKLSSREESEGNDLENDSVVSISGGNTRKLRERFNVEVPSTAGNEKLMKTSGSFGSSNSWSSVKASLRENTEKEVVSRSSSNTAKLVEKFTKERGRMRDDHDSREGSPLSSRGVSVRQMLKQFESGDEMDDDEPRSSKRRQSNLGHKDSCAEVEKDSLTETPKSSRIETHKDSPVDLHKEKLETNLHKDSETHCSKSGSSSFPREQKPSGMNKYGDEKTRSVSDFGTRREPKFV